MRELGVDLADRVPRRLTRELAEQADVVVTMGCGDECPYIPGKRYIDWDLPDPKGRPLDEVRATRDDIAGRVASWSPSLTGTPRSRQPHRRDVLRARRQGAQEPRCMEPRATSTCGSSRRTQRSSGSRSWRSALRLRNRLACQALWRCDHVVDAWRTVHDPVHRHPAAVVSPFVSSSKSPRIPSSTRVWNRFRVTEARVPSDAAMASSSTWVA